MKSALAIGLQKNSPYKNLFNYWLRKYQQVGALSHLYQEYLEVKDCGDEIGPRTVDSIGINNVILLFSILGFGTILSIFSLFLELAMKFGKARHGKPSKTRANNG